MPEDTQYNPIAEIPEAALTAAEQEWGKKPLAQMQAESIRLGGELQLIAAHGDDCLNSPILGGETASAEDRVGAMTQRIATRHFLTQRIAQAQKSERQLKAMVRNMGGDEGGDGGDPDLDRHLQQNLDPLGYERDRGLGHDQSAGFFGEFLHHSGLVDGDQQLQKYYDSHDQSPLAQALMRGGGLTLPMALSNREGVELSHAAVTTAAGISAERAPDRRRVDRPIRMPELLDYIPMEQENRGIYTYINETILSGSDPQTGDQAVAAAIKAEGIISTAEATFKDERVEKNIPTVEVSVPVTYEQLSNTMRARRIIETKLPMMIDQEVDRKALVDLVALSSIGEITVPATGTAGALVCTGVATSVLEAINNQCKRVGRVDANLAVMDTRFYTRFLTEESTSGGYLIRSSSELMPTRTAWGIPVVMATTALSYGTDDDTGAVVGDFANYSVCAYAEQSNFRVLDQHGTEARLLMFRFQSWWRAICIYLRDVAFCKLTVDGP